MIQIATPISHQFEDENTAMEIVSFSDCLEVRDGSVNSRWPKQHLFHSDTNLTDRWSDREHRYLENVFSLKKDLKLVSLQAATCCENPALKGRMFHVNGKIYSRDEMVENAKINIDWLRSVLREGVQIAVENNNYYPTEAYNIITDSDFLTEIVDGNKIYFLFDIAHALVTVHNKQIFYDEYISTLPLKRTIQIHICKPEILDDGTAYDAHDLPDDLMYEEVSELIKRYPVQYLTIEYYKDSKRLIEEIRRYKQLVMETDNWDLSI